MRIILVDSVPPLQFGGVERWLLDAADGLSAIGHSVHAVGRPGARYLGRMQERGITVTHVPFGIRSDPVTAWRLARLARRHEADIALVNRIRELSQLALARRFSPIRTIVGCGIEPLIASRPGARRLCERHLDGLIGRSTHTIEDAGSVAWLRSKPLLHSPGSVSKAQVEELIRQHGGREGVREALSISADAFVVGAAGRLDESKGVGLVLEAFGRFAREVPDAVLIIVGDGPAEHALRDQATADPETASRILFTGYRPDPERFFMAMDVVVAPDTGGLEAFSQSALEAMALGVPVIAATVGGLPELVEDGVTGLQIPPNDPTALLHALIGLAGEPATRRRLGEAAAERTLQRYGRERMIDSLVTFLEGSAA